MTQERRHASMLIGAAALIVVIAGMHAAASLLVPFLLAAFVAIICLPPMRWLIARRVPAGLAVLSIALVLILVAALIGIFLGTSIADFSHNLPAYQAHLQQQTDAMLAWFSRHGLTQNSQLLRDSLNPAVAMGLVGKMVAGLGNALANIFLIVLTVILLLIEGAALPNKWKLMGRHAPSTESFGRFVASVNSYLAIKGWVSLVTGVVIAIWLAVLGVDYPVLWGLIAFLFNFVPNIGSIIAAVPALLLALVQLGPGSALAAAAGYLVVNIVMGNVVEPRFMGKGVGLSTLVVFLSLVFWGWVLGPVGMLLSVPLTMVVKLALEANPGTRWIAVLIGPDVEPEPEASDS
jgi:AI-2 transport protein TqsA